MAQAVIGFRLPSQGGTPLTLMDGTSKPRCAALRFGSSHERNAAKVQIFTKCAGSKRVQKSVSVFMAIHIFIVPGLWGMVLGRLASVER